MFQSTNPSAPGLYWVHSDGSGEAQRLTDGELNDVAYSFSPDGKRLAYFEIRNDANYVLFTAPVESDPSRGAGWSPARVSGAVPGNAVRRGGPGVSRPTAVGWRIASNETGISEVYVRPFPGPGGKWQISTGGGRFPVWSRDGRELLFESADQRVLVVNYTARGESFAASKPSVWSETRLGFTGAYPNYDLAPDGKRLAAIVETQKSRRVSSRFCSTSSTNSAAAHLLAASSGRRSLKAAVRQRPTVHRRASARRCGCGLRAARHLGA